MWKTFRESAPPRQDSPAPCPLERYPTAQAVAQLRRMDQIRCVLETLHQSGSIKATAARLGISKNTVREYKRRAEVLSDEA